MRPTISAIAIFCLCLSACGPRSSLDPSEAITTHRITTAMEPAKAFFAVEESLATQFNSWKDVNQVRQPETGTLIVRGLFECPSELLGDPSWVNVSIKAKTAPGAVALVYTIGRNQVGGMYPSESTVATLRAQFVAMSMSVAEGVNGQLDPAVVAEAAAHAEDGRAAARTNRESASGKAGR